MAKQQAAPATPDGGPFPAPTLLRLGTRGSALARWQTDHVAARLQAAWLELQVEITVLHTQGDRILDKPLPEIGGKGLFTQELEEALRSGTIDLAVHSLKDLPTDEPADLAVAAILARAPYNDIVVSRSGAKLADLPAGAVVGTSSSRRAAQLRHRFPHLQVADIRGNVDTRIRKALDPDGPYDAILLAQAGVERLDHGRHISEVLPSEFMLPAPGQGALAVQTRREPQALAWLAPLDDAPTRVAVTAERAFLQALGGGCAVPIAAMAVVRGDRLFIVGRVTAPDGSRQIDVVLEGALADAAALGTELAQRAKQNGAAALLAGQAP